MQILLYAVCLLGAFVIGNTTKTSVHILQLNNYLNRNFLKWFVSKKWLSFFVSALITAAFISLYHFFDFIKYAILVYLLVLGIITIPKKAKKPLVFTARVKRLLACNIVLIIAVFAAALCLNNKAGTYILLLAVLLCPFITAVAVWINAPLELCIRKWYINDGKKKLASCKDLKIIGITGSYGKTSTKYFLTKLLSAKYNVLMTPASFNTPLGITKTIRENLNATHQVFVCEMGARRTGEIKELCDIVHPHMGIITSIGEQHLETFKSIDNIIKTKFELADSVTEKMFLNFDNKFIADKKINKPFISYGTQNNLDYFVTDISLSENGTSFVINTKDGKKQEFVTKLLGEHNILNIAGAVAVCVEMGMELSELVVPIKKLVAVPHRLELKQRSQRLTIIDDAYNSNPAGAKMALEVLSRFEGQRIVVTPGMVELGQRQAQLNFELGTEITKNCDIAILVGKKQTEPILNGIKSTDFDQKNVFVVDTILQAFEVIQQIYNEKPQFVLLENDLPDNYN